MTPHELLDQGRVLLAQIEDENPDLREWIRTDGERLLRVVVDQLAQAGLDRAATPQAHAPAEDWDLARALRWLVASAAEIVEKPPPGPGTLNDGTGASYSTIHVLCDVARLAGAIAAESNWAFVVAGMDALRVHSHTQLDPADFAAANAAIQAENERRGGLTAEEARRIRRRGLSGTAARGDLGLAEWYVDSDEDRIVFDWDLRFRGLTGRALSQAGGRFVDPPRNWGKAIPLDRVEDFAEVLDDLGQTSLAEDVRSALRIHGSAWAALLDAASEEDESSGASSSTSSDTPTWAWNEQSPLEFKIWVPGKEYGFDVRDALSTHRLELEGYRYWIYAPVAEVGAVAEVLTEHGDADAAERLVDAAKAWEQYLSTHASNPEVLRKARALARRFRHMMELPPKLKGLSADDQIEAVAAELVKAWTLLDGLRPGVTSWQLGAWGRWKLGTKKGREVLLLDAPYEMRRKLQEVIPGAGFLNIGDEYRKQWVVAVPIKWTPELTRQLDREGNFPLATSIRIALLTEQIEAGRRRLEELASARSIDEILDDKTRTWARSEIRKLHWPSGLKPYPYQEVGILYALAADFRALIGDTMGLGKTIEAIGALKIAIDRTTPALVICPSSVTYNWAAEVKKWGPELTPFVVETRTMTQAPKPSRGVVYIASWSSLRRMFDFLRGLHAKCVVMDESHYAKHARAARSKAAAALAVQADGALLLSGTALENKPGDLWHQLHMIDPDAFGSQKEFRARVSPNKRIVGGRVFSDYRPHVFEELREELRGFMIRRLTSEVLDLPEHTRVDVRIQLSPAQRKVYEDLEQDLVAWYAHQIVIKHAKEAAKLVEDGSSIQAAIKQVSEDPIDLEFGGQGLYRVGELKRRIGELKVPQAIAWIHNFLRDKPRESLVVFVEHQNGLDAIGKALDGLGVTWTYIDGSVAPKKRTARVADFQSGKLRVIVITKAAREGITLTRASTMLFTERMWVPSWEWQAEGRIHRISQTRPTFSYYLRAVNTVDDYIADQLSEKADIIDEVMRAEEMETDEKTADNLEDSYAKDVSRSILAGIKDKLEAALATLRTIPTVAEVEHFLQGTADD